ncbi:MAG: pentapeptide repeat-containing protein [Anaerolineae bacterium]
MVNRTQLGVYTRGIYRLLMDVAPHPPRVQAVREVQRRFAENLSSFARDPTEVSTTDAAMQAEIMNALQRCSREVGGQSFEAYCQPAEAADTPASEILSREGPSLAVSSREDSAIFEDLLSWYHHQIMVGASADRGTQRLIERRVLQILPQLEPAQRATIVQRLYDGGLIFDLDPRISISGAYLSRADLTGALLVRAHLTGANLRGAKLIEADLRFANLRRVNLITARLGWARLDGADLTETEMAGAVLMDTSLENARVARANLVKATVKDANLRGADLSGANLLGVHLEAAVLVSANMSGTNLLWTNLTDAVLDQTRLTDAIYNSHTRWPEGFDPRTFEMIIVE